MLKACYYSKPFFKKLCQKKSPILLGGGGCHSSKFTLITVAMFSKTIGVLADI